MPTITITGSSDVSDAWMDEGTPTGNFGTATNMFIGEGNNGVFRYRSLIKFSLAAIPAGSTITAATLSLFTETSIRTSNTRTMRLYRSRRAWTSAGVNWNTYDGTNNWGTGGSGNSTTDYDATDVGSVSVGTGLAANTEIQIAVSTTGLADMINGTFTNNGFLLKMDTESDDLTIYRTTEYAGDVTKIPKLVVTYTAPSKHKLLLLGCG